ncbi:hypothetical protein E2C01_036686 [Portunus trituberculatus]|uniref:Uncharacterized protein n=1 Tax=Portunus trituberculatus TaxID=210409 RepID=A0A5B7F654_PORTR|nr:hypothetical protein [Portunus trituberculatus]
MKVRERRQSQRGGGGVSRKNGESKGRGSDIWISTLPNFVKDKTRDDWRDGAVMAGRPPHCCLSLTKDRSNCTVHGITS